MKYVKNVLFSLCLFVVSFIFVFSVSYAIREVIDSTSNEISMATLSGDIESNYHLINNVYPGDSIEKNIVVKNTGNISSLVRIKVIKKWGSDYKDDTLIQSDNDNLLNIDNIIVNVDGNKWFYKDGYYYYKGILNKNSSIKFTDGYKISSNAGNEYKGKYADISINMEMIQALGDAISLWNITYNDLGIDKYFENNDSSIAYVTFNSFDKGFNIRGNNIDLFSNFKNLVPEVMRTQIISVSNKSDSKVNIYLKALPLDYKNDDLIYELLTKYVKLKITYLDEVLYDDFITSPDIVQNGIFIGEFSNQDSKKLVLTLSVLPEIGDKYQNLVGKIDWQFDAVSSDEGKVIVRNYYKHKDSDYLLLDEYSLSGDIGDTYFIPPKEYDGYILDKDKLPNNATGKYTSDDIVVNYYYNLREDISDVSIVKLGDKILTSKVNNVEYKIDGSIDISSIGNGKVLIVDYLPYKIDPLKSSLNNGIYDEDNMTITWSYDITNNDSLKKDFNINISLVYKDIDYTKDLINKVSIKCIMDNGFVKESSNEVITSFKIPVKIYVNHYKLDEKTLVNTEVINTYVGKSYETKALDSLLKSGYRVSYTKGNIKGIAMDDLVVEYYYAKDISFNPFTGDNIIYYFISFVLSSFIVVVYIYYKDKNNKKLH